MRNMSLPASIRWARDSSWPERNATGKTPRQGFEKVRVALIAASQHHQTAIAAVEQSRQGLDEDIDALLHREPAHHADQRAVRSDGEPGCREQLLLVEQLAVQVLRREVRRQMRIVSRIPVPVI